MGDWAKYSLYGKLCVSCAILNILFALIFAFYGDYYCFASLFFAFCCYIGVYSKKSYK